MEFSTFLAKLYPQECTKFHFWQILGINVLLCGGPKSVHFGHVPVWVEVSPPPLTIEDGGPKHPRTHFTFHQTLIVPRLSLQFVVQLQTTLYVVAFNPSQRWVRGVCLWWVNLARGGPKGPGFCCVFSFQDRPATSNETQGNCILTGYPPANQAKLQKDTPKIRPPTAQSAGDRETVKPFSHGVKR